MFTQPGQRVIRILVEQLERELGPERVPTVLRRQRFTGRIHQPDCTTSQEPLHRRPSAWENPPDQWPARRITRMDKKAKTPKKPKQTKTKDGAKAK